MAVIQVPGQPLGGQRAAVLAHAEVGLAGLVLGHHVRQGADKSVARVRGEQHLAVRGAHQDAHKARTGRGLEAPGERLALPARARQGVRRDRVAAARGVHEHQRLAGPAPGRSQVLVAAAVIQVPGVHLVALGATHPAFFGQNDGDRVVAGQIFVGKGRGLVHLHQLAAALVAKLFGYGQQLFLDERGHAGLGAQGLFQIGLFGLELVLLALQLHLFELCEVSQAGVQDRLDLQLAELERAHQLGLGVVLEADDANHFIQVQVGNQQAVENVQPIVDLLQPVLQAPGDRVSAIDQPLLEQRQQALDRRALVEPDHVHVDPVALFEVRAREQVAHEPLRVHAV